MRLALIPVGSPEFDVRHGAERAGEAVTALRAAGHDVTSGPLVVDAAAAAAASTSAAGDARIVLFATFVDAEVSTAAAGAGTDNRLVLWALPEPRSGAGPRLHSLAGMNLAGHALTRRNRSYRWLYAGPENPLFAERLEAVLEGPAPFVPRSATPASDDVPATALMRGDELRRRLASTTVGLVGDRPEGYASSDFDAAVIADVTGITVDHVDLDHLFRAGTEADAESVAAARERVERRMEGVAALDQAAVASSLRLDRGLRALCRDRHWSAVAARCFPECLTVYGGAACTAAAMLTEDGLPTVCEADVLGAATALLLLAVADEPAFTAELVDLDVATNTGIVWHCGNAPPHMAAPNATPRAIPHPTRGRPLAAEFALKPGRVTLARLSQTGDRLLLVVGGGEMMEGPAPSRGTGGILRFDHPVDRVLETIMGRGLEHHFGIVYGDHHTELAAVAAGWRMPVLSL